jgi:hypothetical protein
MAVERVGFFKLVSDTDDKAMLGALLVTDLLGKPEEFRVTYPVKPTSLQRQLYGAALWGHVGIELCGAPLFKSLKAKPELLVVGHTDFVALENVAGASHVFFLDKAGETIRVAGAGNPDRAGLEKVKSANNRFSPLRVHYPVSYSIERIRSVYQNIVDLYSTIDLLEPFQRIDVAVKMLRDGDDRFR